MKVKIYFLIAVFSVAFGLISLWVILSRKKEKPLRLKYKFGGLLISLFATINTGCSNFVTSCYDPVMPNSVYLSRGNYYNDGDSVFAEMNVSEYFNHYAFEIADSTDQILQSGKIDTTQNDKTYFVLSSNVYVGDAVVKFYGVADDSTKSLIQQNSLILNESEN